MSEYLFTTCSKCKKEISKSADKCTQCGTKLKKISFFKIVGFTYLAVVVIRMIGFSDAKTDTVTQNQTRSVASENQLPQDEANFVDVVTRHIENFNLAKNQLQESAFRDSRMADLAKIFSGYKIENWQGTVSEIKTNSEGNAILAVRISKGIEIKTWNNALSDIYQHTLIDKKSKVYLTLMNMKEGDEIHFSGSFLPSDKDHFEESSVTISGSMKHPEFLFRFSDIKLK